MDVTRLAQNLNTHRRELSVQGFARKPVFATLLPAVNEVEGIRPIWFTSPHPHDLSPNVINSMAQSQAGSEHIHFPLQSGSDRILHRMNRSYRAARYLSWLERIRDAIPEVGVTTDIIVGFPGETEEDFRATLDVVRAAGFDQAFTFQYSPRPGTPAATDDEQVPKPVVQERFERLVALQEGVSLEKNRALVGREVEVLVEGQGRKGRLAGRTRTNKLVHFEGADPPGTFRTVLVTAAHPHHVEGVAVREAAGALA